MTSIEKALQEGDSHKDNVIRELESRLRAATNLIKKQGELIDQLKAKAATLELPHTQVDPL